MKTAKTSMFEIAMRYEYINRAELYKDDGYKNVEEYGRKVLGYKKAFSYQLLNTARRYLTENNGTFVSVIAHKDNDYTVSQLQELNSLKPHYENGVNDATLKGGTVDDTGKHEPSKSDKISQDIEDSAKRYIAMKLDENGVISPAMTSTAIRKVVKDYNDGVIDETGKQLFNTSEKSDDKPEKSDDADKLIMALLDIDGAIDIAVADERIKNNAEYLKAFNQFKQFIDSLKF